MDPASFTKLPVSISTARLQPYIDACEGNLDQALRLYTWNIEASASFWGELHVLEISLRNTIHDCMRQRFSQEDWWVNLGVKLTYPQTEMLAVALGKAAENARRNNRSLLADDVIAASVFGFWNAFLGSAKKLQFETLYWQPFLKNAFPGFSGTRRNLYKELDYIRLFRNRVAHHEPIFSRFLIGDHNRILNIAKVIDPEIADYMDSHSRVIECLSRKDRAVTKGFATRF